MKITLIVLGHVIVIAVAVVLGLKLNPVIEDYAGVSAALSLLLGLYTTGLNILYRKNRRFHLFVNRQLGRFRRSHTYWEIHFDFVLPYDTSDQTPILQRVVRCLQSRRCEAINVTEETPASVRVLLDGATGLVFRLRSDDDLDGGEKHLYTSFDRPIVVPLGLYDARRKWLGNLVEDLREVVHPIEIRASLKVNFRDGERNPYYGLMVNSLPQDVLQDFRVSFFPEAGSQCRVEVGKEYVNIEGKRVTEFFEGVQDVLGLRALPKGTTR